MGPPTGRVGHLEVSASDTAEGNIDKSDIKLRVKTLSKKCYGYGVGCNVEYRVVVDGAYMDDWPDEGEVEVSYTVRGPDDQYSVVELRDGRIGGKMFGDKLEHVLNEHAAQGWQLKAITSVEVKGRVGPGGVEGLLVTFERRSTELGTPARARASLFATQTLHVLRRPVGAHR